MHAQVRFQTISFFPSRFFLLLFVSVAQSMNSLELGVNTFPSMICPPSFPPPSLYSLSKPSTKRRRKTLPSCPCIPIRTHLSRPHEINTSRSRGPCSSFPPSFVPFSPLLLLTSLKRRLGEQAWGSVRWKMRDERVPVLSCFVCVCACVWTG